MTKFLPICMILMLIVFYLSFRQLRGVILPFSVAVMSLLAVWGLVYLLGWKVHMITLIMPALILAIGGSFGIHMVSHYQEENSPGAGLSNIELAAKSILTIGLPSIVCAAVAICSLISLLFSIVVPVWQLGILTAAGVGLAFVGSLLFIPAWLSILPRPRPVAAFSGSASSSSLSIDRLLCEISALVTGHPKIILAAIICVAAFAGSGVTCLEFDANPENYYSTDAPVNNAGHIIKRHFDGLSALSMAVRGDIKDPAVMKHIDQLETELKQLPNVGNTLSIAKFVRKMNVIMHDEDKSFDRIPDDRDSISRYFMLYSMSGDACDFDRLVDFSYQNAQLTAIINDGNAASMKQTVNHIRRYIAEHPDCPFVTIGGIADLFTELSDDVKTAQTKTILLAMLFAGLLAGLLFRSPVAAVFALLPSIFSLLIVHGAMGCLGVKPGISTPLLSSLSVAVGIDYSIRYLWRYRSERACGNDYTEAVKVTLATAGRGILFSALPLMLGFSAFIFSDFVPVRFTGIMVTAIISSCVMCTMLFLPAVCLTLKPGFLEH